MKTADLSPELLAYLTHLSCVGVFCTRLADHSGVSLEDAARRLDQLGPNLRCLTESPQGWTVLGSLLTADSLPPLTAAIH